MRLICPVCGKPLEKINKEAICENNHHFDYAKSGYLNLLVSNKKVHGDDAAMVKARSLFLNSGAYGFLRDRIAQLAAGRPGSVRILLRCLRCRIPVCADTDRSGQ